MVRDDAGQYDIEVEKRIMAEPIFEILKAQQKTAQVFVANSLVASFCDGVLKSIVRFPQIMTACTCHCVDKESGVVILLESEKSKPFLGKARGMPLRAIEQFHGCHDILCVAQQGFWRLPWNTALRQNYLTHGLSSPRHKHPTAYFSPSTETAFLKVQGFFGSKLSCKHSKPNDLLGFNSQGTTFAEMSLTVDAKLLQLPHRRREKFILLQKSLDCNQTGAEADNRQQHSDFGNADTERVFTHLQSFPGQLQVGRDGRVRQTQDQTGRVGQLELSVPAVDATNGLNANIRGLVDFRYDLAQGSV